VRYFLDPATKVAKRQPWRNVPPFPTAVEPHGGQQSAPESLGTRMIEGVSCEGTNDRPITAVTEVWKSAELQLTVLDRSRDPRKGEQILKLVNIKRDEPDAALFRPPADYKIEDTPDWEKRTPSVPVDQSLPGGVYRIGGDVTAPILTSKVEPKYSEEAQQAKLSGTVLLSIIVRADGFPVDIKVVRPLGMGLDEKAIESVSQWRFRTGLKSGQPVAVWAQVEVNFQLLAQPF
jgi:TonB family protein